MPAPAYNLSWPSTYMDSQRQTENTVFDPCLVEHIGAKPGDTEGQLTVVIEKKSTNTWTHMVLTCIIEGSAGLSLKCQLRVRQLH